MQTSSSGADKISTRPDDEPFYAYVAVESATMTLAELTEAIGVSPDRSWDIGDRSARGVTFKVANWTKYLDMEPAVHPGTEGLSNAIELLTDDLADTLAGLAENACDIMVNLVQNLSADLWSKGVNLSVEALAWVVRARAEVDIDQYVMEFTGEERDILHSALQVAVATADWQLPGQVRATEEAVKELMSRLVD